MRLLNPLNHSHLIATLATLLLLPLLTSCAEPTREDYRDEAAETVCDEAERCGNLGDSSYDDCIIENTERFNDLWPADECDNGRINENAFETCMNRARTAACQEDILDVGQAWNDCRASNVCIDAAANDDSNSDSNNNNTDG